MPTINEKAAHTSTTSGLAKEDVTSKEHVEELPHIPSPEDEKKVLRKLDFTILPWIMLMYFLSYMDRSNTGNARKIGLEKDLHLTSGSYALASSTFYIATFLFGTIGGLMLKVVKPSTWLALCMVGWGAMSSLQALCHNGGSLAAVRFFLGLFEASFAPGCALYLSFWYLKTELSFRIACYAGTSALSGVFGGLISYGIGKHEDSLLIPAWKVLFIVEGVPTVVLGVATYFYLPDRPETGRHRWFTEEEHQILLNRRSRFVKNEDNGIDLHQVAGAFKDYRLYLFCVIYAGLSLSLAVLSIFLPTIVSELGYHAVSANLMTAPVYGTAYACLLVTAYVSDKFQQRGIAITIGGMISGIGYILLGLLHSNTPRYVVTFLAATGTYMAFPIVLAWIASTFAADTKSGVGIGIVIAVTHAVGVAASNIYPSKDSPQYLSGNMISGSLGLAGSAGALLMSVILHLENRRKDRKYGRSEKGIAITMDGDADKHRDFRYVL